MEEKTCNECSERDTCTAPCATVNAILWHENRIMEKSGEKDTVCFPMNKEVHFCECASYKLDRATEGVPWSSGDARLRKTAVFIERFFNKTPCKELAERYGVTENTIVSIYGDAVESLNKIIDTLDARKGGIKAMKPDRFTEDQKYFLLVSVFGFTRAEVARMFNRCRGMVDQKVKRMSDRYGAAFSGENKKESPIDDLPMPAKLTSADVVAMVEAYTEQGLSHAQAFRRIADRQSEVVGRFVKVRAIESRYSKAAAKKPFKSAYDNLTKEQIVQRMAY